MSDMSVIFNLLKFPEKQSIL